MFKKVLVITLIVLMAVMSAACGNTAEQVSDVVDAVKDSVTQIAGGNVQGEVGKNYGTQWFQFTVTSIEKVDSYAGYTPAEGAHLYDVLITEKSTFDADIPMGTFDFYMDSTRFTDYVYPMNPLDDTMMPEEFNLAPGESATYHMVFEIEADVPDLKLMYTEVDETDAEGATFTIDIPLS